MGKIIKQFTSGLVTVKKTGVGSYSILVPSLRPYEVKAFESALRSFSRSFNNISMSNRRQSRLKGF